MSFARTSIGAAFAGQANFQLSQKLTDRMSAQDFITARHELKIVELIVIDLYPRFVDVGLRATNIRTSTTGMGYYYPPFDNLNRYALLSERQPTAQTLNQ